MFVWIRCDDKADAMLGLNADNADNSWQDLDYYFYCHPLQRAGNGGTGTLVYYSDPSSGPEDVNLGVYTKDDVFQIYLNAAGKLDYTMNGEIVRARARPGGPHSLCICGVLRFCLFCVRGPILRMWTRQTAGS